MKFKPFKVILLLALLGFSLSTKPVPTPNMDDAFAIACIPLAAYRLYRAYQEVSLYNSALGISAAVCTALPFMAPAAIPTGLAAGFRTVSGLDMAWPSTNQKEDPRDLEVISHQNNTILCNGCGDSAIYGSKFNSNGAKGKFFCKTCLEKESLRINRWGLRAASNLWQLGKIIIAVPTVVKAAPIAITASASYISKSNWLSKLFSNKCTCPRCGAECQNVNT